jgi:hypothetical protein
VSAMHFYEVTGVAQILALLCRHKQAENIYFLLVAVYNYVRVKKLFSVVCKCNTCLSSCRGSGGLSAWGLPLSHPTAY